MKKGFLIFALGHSNYYRMAEALAASLRVNGVDADGISIGLVCDSEAKILNPHLFSDILTLPWESFTETGKIVFNNATIRVYDLSPYDITIKLDADIIWIPGRRPGELFEDLADVDITFENRGHGWGQRNSVWAKEIDLKETYNLHEGYKLYKIFGEFLYFKKTAGNRQFFQKAKQVYKRRKVKTTASFANGAFTDELAFQVACMLTETYPHKDDYTPIYNSFLELKQFNRKYPYELAQEGFYGYSIGGNITGDFTKKNYDGLAKFYFTKLGLFNPYQVKNKRQFLPERKPL